MAKRKELSTWSVYLRSLNHSAYDMSGLLDHHAAQFLNTQSIYPAFFHSVPLMYLLDYTTGRYLIMSNEAKQVMKGRYADYLQRNCFIKSDGKGNPLVSFGMIINHNHFSSQQQVLHTIFLINKRFSWGIGSFLLSSYYLGCDFRYI